MSVLGVQLLSGDCYSAGKSGNFVLMGICLRRSGVVGTSVIPIVDVFGAAVVRLCQLCRVVLSLDSCIFAAAYKPSK